MMIKPSLRTFGHHARKSPVTPLYVWRPSMKSTSTLPSSKPTAAAREVLCSSAYRQRCACDCSYASAVAHAALMELPSAGVRSCATCEYI
eukprot:scaffold7011_cov67-Phaeocystis_antarctica.AAC.3